MSQLHNHKTGCTGLQIKSPSLQITAFPSWIDPTGDSPAALVSYFKPTISCVALNSCGWVAPQGQSYKNVMSCNDAYFHSCDVLYLNRCKIPGPFQSLPIFGVSLPPTSNCFQASFGRSAVAPPSSMIQLDHHEHLPLARCCSSWWSKPEMQGLQWWGGTWEHQTAIPAIQAIQRPKNVAWSC